MAQGALYFVKPIREKNLKKNRHFIYIYIKHDYI